MICFRRVQSLCTFLVATLSKDSLKHLSVLFQLMFFSSSSSSSSSPFSSSSFQLDIWLLFSPHWMQSWCNPLWLPGLKAPTNYFSLNEALAESLGCFTTLRKAFRWYRYAQFTSNRGVKNCSWCFSIHKKKNVCPCRKQCKAGHPGDSTLWQKLLTLCFSRAL